MARALEIGGPHSQLKNVNYFLKMDAPGEADAGLVWAASHGVFSPVFRR
jgi:hypothetical protein